MGWSVWYYLLFDNNRYNAMRVNGYSSADQIGSMNYGSLFQKAPEGKSAGQAAHMTNLVENTDTIRRKVKSQRWEFVKWVVIAFVIACPIAYYVMNKWLENFAYKTTLSWWVFALAGLLALGIALLTLSWQSWKVARKNPVEALRYE